MVKKLIISILTIVILFNSVSVIPISELIPEAHHIESTSHAAGVCPGTCGGTVVHAGGGVCGSTNYVITGSWDPVEEYGPSHIGPDAYMGDHGDKDVLSPFTRHYAADGTWTYSSANCGYCGDIYRYRTYAYKCNDCGKEATETSGNTLAPGKIPKDCPAGGGKHLFNSYNDKGATCYKCNQTIAQSFGPCGGRTTQYYDCQDCGQRYYGSNPGKCTKAKTYDSHAFGGYVVTNQPTCTAAGTQIRTCTRCSAKESASVAALGHVNPSDYDYTSVPGYHIKNCTRCSGRLDTQKNPYTVVYNGNNATSGTMTNSRYTYELAANLIGNTFARKGYNFKNWNTNPEGTGVTYTNSQNVSNLTTQYNGVFNLYAQWQLITHNIQGNVTWDDQSNKYSSRPSDVTVTLNRTPTTGEVTRVPDPVKVQGESGYTFKDVQTYDTTTGNAYNYSVNQNQVAGYETLVNGYKVTNKLVLPTYTSDISYAPVGTYQDKFLKNGKIKINANVKANTNNREKVRIKSRKSNLSY